MGNLGNLYKDINKTNEAIDYYKEAIKNNPKGIININNLSKDILNINKELRVISQINNGGDLNHDKELGNIEILFKHF